MNGTRYGPLDDCYPPQFSPDGRRMAVGVARRNGRRYIVDGRAERRYHGVWDFAFSPDSRHYCYSAAKGGFRAPRWLDVLFGRFFSNEHAEYVVIDGATFGPYTGVGTRSWMLSPPRFTPDSRHVFWAVAYDSQTDVYVDGIVKATLPTTTNVLLNRSVRQVQWPLPKEQLKPVTFTEVTIEPEDAAK